MDEDEAKPIVIEMSKEAMLAGFDFIDLLTTDVLAMRRKWNRQKVAWKISPEGVAADAQIDALDNLCDLIEDLMPVMKAAPEVDWWLWHDCPECGTRIGKPCWDVDGLKGIKRTQPHDTRPGTAKVQAAKG